MPCSSSRARELLSKEKAVVVKLHPFTILLKGREEGSVQGIEVKIDPGSKTTGIALVGHFQGIRTVLWAANLHHRGGAVRSSLDSRRSLRRGRRHRKTPYRKARFDNRRRGDGRLAPSLQSRVDNVHTWVERLRKLAPISSIAIETVRFDTQKLQDPEISGAQYQQGDLMGYEIREYLLEKWGRKCAYCSVEGVRLEIDHIVSRSHGGTDRVSNLTICCRGCNSKKSNSSIEEFLKDKPELCSKILSRSKAPLKDTAAVNATRHAIAKTLSSCQLPITLWSGGRTKYNRRKQGYEKDHWIDAACVGETGESVRLTTSFPFLDIKATGRGSRQFCLMDKYGFPRTSGKKQKSVYGFKTGDHVKAVVTKGKKSGTFIGRLAVRSSGYFCIDTATGKIDGIGHIFCKSVQRIDGYNYTTPQPKRGAAFPPHPKEWGLHAVI